MRIGIFGGSFDPVHLGHLLLAEYCREQASLDQVLFVPLFQSPTKPVGPVAKHKQRCEMLKLALGGHPAFQVCDCEIERAGISYTVDTLTELSAQRPDDEFFLLLGADSLESFPNWKDPEGICRLAMPLVGARRGSDCCLEPLKPFLDEVRFQQVLQSKIDFPWIEISSTEIRNAICASCSIRYRVPRSVEMFIETQHLYQKRGG